MPQSQLYIGLMSGTSADAIDAVLVDLQSTPRLIARHTIPLPVKIRQQVHALSLPGQNEIDRMGALDADLGRLFAQASLELLSNAGVNAAEVAAIGSHGQTIRHRPPDSAEGRFTLQIGDPNLIAELTGITTVADFRRRDMAAGGQGAPLVPAFHRAIFHTRDKDRVIINIGGMANITWLPAQGKTLGFDTGPGNVLMDTWIGEHLGKPYDKNGDWAATGQPYVPLLTALLADPYFTLQAPKSTGRESFNRVWLERNLHKCTPAPSPADIQATLLELTAVTIANSIDLLSQAPKEIFVCGGGAYNAALMKRLKTLLAKDVIASTSALDLDPQWIEAMAFAWLAQQTIHHRPGNICDVTGAKREVILGGIYHAG
ncbi:anhydro-N-acetylmuramic acid kinase [Cellvibrio sp. OA-2007]|uniref:anhydro-N-acetylmuramic acid kinase n=1 Tax=Cellvibrio sp. OA-2007 TaxID=529823 RepID=UPI000784DA54|nr:anhydro-N-acetylmuramic acid kinase [Cellvibrio sp. OA-2007]